MLLLWSMGDRGVCLGRWDVGSKEVGGHGSQAASAIAMRVQAKKVAAGILESKTALGGVDEEKMDVDEEQNIHALRPQSHHLLRNMDRVMKSPTLPDADADPQTSGAAGAREDSNGDDILDHPLDFKFALQLVFKMLSSYYDSDTLLAIHLNTLDQH